jgi:hypothetical protein
MTASHPRFQLPQSNRVKLTDLDQLQSLAAGEDDED